MSLTQRCPHWRIEGSRNAQRPQGGERRSDFCEGPDRGKMQKCGRRDVLDAGEAVRQWSVSGRGDPRRQGAVSASGAAGGEREGYAPCDEAGRSIRLTSFSCEGIVTGIGEDRLRAS